MGAGDAAPYTRDRRGSCSCSRLRANGRAPSERTRAPRADDGEVADRRADGARATACASDARERPVVSRGPTLRGHERTARGPTPGPKAYGDDRAANSSSGPPGGSCGVARDSRA